MSYSSTYRVERGKRARLEDVDARDTGAFADHEAARPAMERDCERLRTLQTRLRAEGRRALLVVFQAVDAGGKDGAVRHVMSALDPRGARAHAFEPPTPLEAAHDFLWRVHAQAPALGEIVLFNRSHYEDVLVPSAHGTLPKDAVAKRLRRIEEFEKNLVQAGTVIRKFYLHVTPDEQLRRFEARLDDPDKRWKADPRDLEERALWSAYRAAYEAAIACTSRRRAPWFIVPANAKWFRNLVVTRIIVETLEELDPCAPEPAFDVQAMRRALHGAGEPS